MSIAPAQSEARPAVQLRKPAPRKYVLRRRAERQEETRRRILEATIALHSTVGPAQTTFSAVAERAGVQRVTLYRHFPDERALYRAAAAYFSERNPAPDPHAWRAEPDPDRRLRRALGEVYAYHRRVEPLLTNVIRDRAIKPVIEEVNEPFEALWGLMEDVLVVGWPRPGQTRGAGGAHRAKTRRETVLRAAIGHALQCGTWRSLVRQFGLTDAEAVELMVGAVCAAAMR